MARRAHAIGRADLVTGADTAKEGNMRGQIRIRSDEYDVRRVVRRWQTRYRTSGAVHFADPSTLLVGADTEIEALENLLRSLHATDVEVMWRAPRAAAPKAVAVAPTEA